MAYKVSTLKKRPGVVSRVELGELDIQVVVENRAELLDLLELTTRVVLIVKKWLGDEIKEFEGVMWKGRGYDHRLEEIVDRLGDRSRAKVAAKTKDKVILERLSQDKRLFVRAAVAGNINTPLAILARLSEDAEAYVRGCVAQNEQSSPQLLEKLSRDPGWWARYWVASRGPVSILERLSRDPLAVVRTKVVQRKDCPVAILERLGRDAQAGVRMGVADNKRCPKKLLYELARDPGEMVRRTALARLKKRK